jgi:hypothetical protein
VPFLAKSTSEIWKKVQKTKKYHILPKTTHMKTPTKFEAILRSLTSLLKEAKRIFLDLSPKNHQKNGQKEPLHREFKI